MSIDCTHKGAAGAKKFSGSHSWEGPQRRHERGDERAERAERAAASLMLQRMDVFFNPGLDLSSETIVIRDCG